MLCYACVLIVLWCQAGDERYHVTWRVMNSKEYSSVAQSRPRVYIVGVLGAAHKKFAWPTKVRQRPLADFLDEEPKLTIGLMLRWLAPLLGAVCLSRNAWMPGLPREGFFIQ